VKKAVILFLMISLLVGCATVTLYRAVGDNKAKLSRLAVGMSKDEALAIMGTKPIILPDTIINNPYRIASIHGARQKFEIVYYVTDVLVEDGIIDDNELTPIVFFNNELQGWGWDYVNNIR